MEQKDKFIGDDCCTVVPTHDHENAEDHDGHNHGNAEGKPFFQTWGLALISLVLLLGGIAVEQIWKPAFFDGWISLSWYLAAYLPVGLPVLWKAWKTIIKGNIFTEFFLMSLATLGAFAIREYPEGVAVMLFYAVGELFQDAAVSRAKRNIKALLDVRPDIAHVFRNAKIQDIHPEEVMVGEVIQVKPEKKSPWMAILARGKVPLILLH